MPTGAELTALILPALFVLQLINTSAVRLIPALLLAASGARAVAAVEVVGAVIIALFAALHLLGIAVQGKTVQPQTVIGVVTLALILLVRSALVTSLGLVLRRKAVKARAGIGASLSGREASHGVIKTSALSRKKPRFAVMVSAIN